MNIVTIDGETAKDFDDAVLVRALANGNTELQVHIADVSWYVRPESALDTEARVRGNSRLLPRPRRANAAARALERHVLPAAA